VTSSAGLTEVDYDKINKIISNDDLHFNVVWSVKINQQDAVGDLNSRRPGVYALLLLISEVDL